MSLIKEIRTDPDKFKKTQVDRFADPTVVDRILELDRMAATQDFLFGKYNQFKKLLTSQIRKAGVPAAPETDAPTATAATPVTADEEVFNQVFELLKQNKSREATDQLGGLQRNVLVALSKYVDGKLDAIDSQ